MLALASLVDILENVTLDLHMVVWTVISFLSIVLYLVDKTVKIVILSGRVVARGPVLLTLHPTLIILHIQIELVYHILSFSLACSSYVPSHRILADLLLEKSLVVLVLLSILV